VSVLDPRQNGQWLWLLRGRNISLSVKQGNTCRAATKDVAGHFQLVEADGDNFHSAGHGFCFCHAGTETLREESGIEVEAAESGYTLIIV
jgi:hypothetical protein